MGLFDFVKKFTQQESASTRELKTEMFYVRGVSYYTENIGKLACSNPDWKSTAVQIKAAGKAGKHIYRYNYVNKPVKLFEEPGNKHDKNAVAVFIAGELVGYIGKEDNVHVKSILKRHEIKYITGYINGGQYKIINDDSSIDRFEEQVSIKVKIAYV